MSDALLPKKNIAVLGAGFGGVAAARALGRALRRSAELRKLYDLIVIDRSAEHIYTPGLYEVATAAREDADPLTLKHTAAIPLEESFSGLPIRIIQDEVLGVEPSLRAETPAGILVPPSEYLIRLRDGGTIRAEYLVLALGAVVNDFGIPGVPKHGLVFKNFGDALRVRSAITETFQRTAQAHIVIAGGGATGVELTGELVSLTRHLRRAWKRDIRPRFTLVEAGERLLPGPPLIVAEIAKKRLERLGVTVRLHTRIIEVAEGTATVQAPEGANTRIAFDRFIWSGGIKPSPVLAGIVVPKDQRGRCTVDLDLTIHGENNLFAIGDLTCFADPATNQPLPSVATIAMAEGSIAAINVLARINRQPLRHYHPPKHTPMIVPVCGKWAIAYVAGFTAAGFSVFLLRLAAALRYFLKVLPPLKAFRFFLRSAAVYFRND